MSATYTPVPKPASTKGKKKSSSNVEKVPSYKPPKQKKHPERDEFELEELGFALEEAYNDKTDRVFHVYQKDKPIIGRVTKMDAATKLVSIEKFMDVQKVHFLDILKVDSISN